MGLINCSKNPLTEKLDALKGQLDGLLDDIAAAGNSALAGLSDQLSQLEDGIKGAIPELPELPDFKTELGQVVALLTTAPEQAAAKIQEIVDKFGGAIPDLDDIIGKLKLGEFDICKDAPNVEIKTVEKTDPDTGEVTTKSVAVEKAVDAKEQTEEVAVPPFEESKQEDKSTTLSEVNQTKITLATATISSDKIKNNETLKKVEKHFNEKIGDANKELNDFEEKNEESFEELKKAIYPDTYQIMGNLTLDNVNIKSLIDRLQGVYGNGQTYEEMSQSNKDAVNILFQGLFQYTAVKIIRFFNSDLRSTIAKNAQLQGSTDILADKERYVSDYIDEAISTDIRSWEPELGLVDEYAIRIFGEGDTQFVANIYTYEEIKSKDFSNVRQIDMLGVTLDELKTAYVETFEDRVIEETYNSQTISEATGVRQRKFEDITIVLPNGEATTFDDPRKNEVPYYFFREVGRPDRRVVNKRVQSAETTDTPSTELTPEDIALIEAELTIGGLPVSTPTTGSTSATAPTPTTGTTASTPTPSSGTSSGY